MWLSSPSNSQVFLGDDSHTPATHTVGPKQTLGWVGEQCANPAGSEGYMPASYYY
jgi:hypothetical protein